MLIAPPDQSSAWSGEVGQKPRSQSPVAATRRWTDLIEGLAPPTGSIAASLAE